MGNSRSPPCQPASHPDHEDATALRVTTAKQIPSNGEFSAEETESASAAETLLANDNARYDAILLDIGLPDRVGRDFCSELRRDGRQLPIIMATGADAKGDVVRGLDAGANEYLAKPSACASSTNRKVRSS